MKVDAFFINLTFVCFYKTFMYMENVKLVFSDKENTANLVAFTNTKNKLFIEIDMFDCPPSFIALNKSTAIKLSKEIRKQISYMEDE